MQLSSIHVHETEAGVSPPPPPPRRFWNVSAQHGESCEEQGARAALEPLGAREPYALRGAAPTTSTEAGGKLHVCATQLGAGCGVQLVSWRRGPTGAAGCDGAVRVVGRGLRIVPCDRRAGLWARRTSKRTQLRRDKYIYLRPTCRKLRARASTQWCPASCWPRHWDDCPQHPLLVGEAARARGSTNRHGTTVTPPTHSRCRFPDWPRS